MFGLLAVLLWSTVATAFKLSLIHLTPLQLLSYSSLVSLFVLLGVVWWQGELDQILPVARSRPGLYLLLGAVNPFLYYFILFAAYDLLPAQQAQPLNYTWALTLSLLAVPMLGQRLRRRDYSALALGYAGVLVISTKGDLLSMQFDSPLGVLLALVSTLFWALYWILNTRSEAPPVVSLLLCFVVGTPLIWLFCWWSDGFVWSLSGVAGAVYIGIFEMGITFVFWLLAMKKAEHTSRVANLIFLSPFISLIFIHFLLGEEIYAATFIGLAMIVSAVMMQQLSRRK